MSVHTEAQNEPDYSICDFMVTSGDANGVSLNNGFVQISQSLCMALAPNEIKSILVTYKVTSRFGAEIPKTALFKLSSSTHGPIISSPFEDRPSLRNGVAQFDLMSNYRAPNSY